MRKNMLGLLAIGGALAYAHKKRGGDFTLASLKDTVTNLVGGAKDTLSGFMTTPGQPADGAAPVNARDDSTLSPGAMPH